MKKIFPLKKKRYLIPTITILILIVFRLALPSIVKNYMNKTLNSGIPGYTGSVDDVGISLYRGAYQLYGFKLKSTESKSDIPFLDLPQNDISIHWMALLHGKIVSELILTNPKINYVKEDQKEQPVKKTEAKDWSETLTNIIPIDINRLEIIQGEISFVEVTSDPKIDLDIKQLNLLATNLRNVRTKGKLPSKLKVSGVSMGGGSLSVKGGMNLIKKIPDVDIALEFTGIDITALNNLTNHYANLDFEKGNLNIFSEIAIADGYLEGYIKPLLKDTQILGKEASILNTLWEGAVGFFKFIFTNQSKDVLASKVPLEGDLNKVDTNVLIAVGNIIKNAWIDAFKDKTDETINYRKVIKKLENSDKES